MKSFSKAAGFLTTESGDRSLSRLLMFMSFFPATAVLLWEHSADVLGWYVNAYVLAYAAGKTTDAIVASKGKKKNVVDSE